MKVSGKAEKKYDFYQLYKHLLLSDQQSPLFLKGIHDG